MISDLTEPTICVGIEFPVGNVQLVLISCGSNDLFAPLYKTKIIHTKEQRSRKLNLIESAMIRQNEKLKSKVCGNIADRDPSGS